MCGAATRFLGGGCLGWIVSDARRLIGKLSKPKPGPREVSDARGRAGRYLTRGGTRRAERHQIHEGIRRVEI